MTKKVESGKSRLIKGSLLYLWEEMKTMNMMKFRALYRIGTGYIRMRFFSKSNDKKRIEHHDVDRGYVH